MALFAVPLYEVICSLICSRVQNIFEFNALNLFLSEFIPCIFSSGIKEDKISTVNILLSTLKTKVRVWYSVLFCGLSSPGCDRTLEPQCLRAHRLGDGKLFLRAAVLSPQETCCCLPFHGKPQG